MPDDLGEILDCSDELTRAGRHEEHLELMREALARHPDELEIVIRAAEAHLAEAPERAAELAGEAVERAPEDPVTLMRATSVMLYTKRLDDARKLFVRAGRRAPEDFAFAGDLAHIAGQLYFAQGDAAKAVEMFRAAFDAEPEMPGYGFALATVLKDQGEFERALEVAEEALGHRPGDQAVEDLRLYLHIAVHGLDDLPPGVSVTQTPPGSA